MTSNYLQKTLRNNDLNILEAEISMNSLKVKPSTLTENNLNKKYKSEN